MGAYQVSAVRRTGLSMSQASAILLKEIFKLCREHDAVSLEADKQKIAQEILAKIKQLKSLQKDGEQS